MSKGSDNQAFSKIALGFILGCLFISCVFSAIDTFTPSSNSEDDVSTLVTTDESTTKGLSLGVSQSLQTDKQNVETAITPTSTPTVNSGGGVRALESLTVAPTSDSDVVYVYITDTGSKYHRADCRYLAYSCHKITLEEAIRRGYEPCKVCKP